MEGHTDDLVRVNGEISMIDVISADISTVRNISAEMPIEGLINEIDDLIRITGEVDGMHTINADLGSLSSIAVDVNIPQSTGSTYGGDYLVTPKAHVSTVLETKGKTLIEDVVVIPIPYYEVSNVSGNTVYIANEV